MVALMTPTQLGPHSVNPALPAQRDEGPLEVPHLPPLPHRGRPRRRCRSGRRPPRSPEPRRGAPPPGRPGRRGPEHRAPRRYRRKAPRRRPGGAADRLTGQTGPGKPNFTSRRTVSPPRFPGRSEAPITATDAGSSDSRDVGERAGRAGQHRAPSSRFTQNPSDREREQGRGRQRKSEEVLERIMGARAAGERHDELRYDVLPVEADEGETAGTRACSSVNPSGVSRRGECDQGRQDRRHARPSARPGTPLMIGACVGAREGRLTEPDHAQDRERHAHPEGQEARPGPGPALEPKPYPREHEEDPCAGQDQARQLSDALHRG